MTQEVSYLRVILSAQVKADIAHMHISGESLYNKTNEMLHAFGTNRMTHQFPICEYWYQLKLMADIAQMHIRGESL